MNFVEGLGMVDKNGKHRHKKSNYKVALVEVTVVLSNFFVEDFFEIFD
jgi:hypothetical protein